MPKGRTSAPLLIVVQHKWIGHEAVQALRAAGHTVVAYGDQVLTDPKPDLILHEDAHNWSEVMFVEEEKKNAKYRPYLEAALAAARARKRGKA